MEQSRRDFLKGAGIASGVALIASLGGCVSATNYPTKYTQDFYPALDNTYDIGTALLRYKDFFAVNAYVTNIIVSGTISQFLTTVNGDATLGATASMVICSKLTPFTVTLPVSAGAARTIQIKNVGVGVVTVEGNGGDTIDDELNQTLNQDECISIVDYIAGKWAIY